MLLILFILLCRRLCVSSTTLGNTGTQLKNKTSPPTPPIPLRKFIKSPCLLLTRLKKGLPVFPNAFKFQNNKCSISDHKRTSFMNAGYDLHLQFPSVSNKETQTFTCRSKSNLYNDAELLSKKHSARDSKILTVANGQFKLCTYLNSNS